ncbi:MAG: hypothetical protein PW792_13835 [Acidobacteriaceae bacterium]|nr:hypothetical protein [Acidobacteriaceae bacterium]
MTFLSITRRLIIPVTAAAVTLALAGCAMTNTATTTSATTAASLTGHIMGGNQPVVGSSVYLYGAGSTGYGLGSQVYASTTSAYDAYGSFSFTKNSTNTGANPGGNTWGCPASGDPQMFLVALGGNSTGNGTANNPNPNSAIALVASIGKCSTVSNATFANINEVTTVASMAALQQYYNPVSGAIGAPATTQGQLGFNNAVATISTLVNTSAGTANTTYTPSSSVSGVTVTATPESAKINTIANILAACVNSTDASSDNCTTLFSNSVPPSPSVISQPSLTFQTANNTLQAIYFMLTNPTSGSPTAVGKLFGLTAAAAPFQPSLTAAPSDWTIGISYTTAGSCSIGYPLDYPNGVAIDSQGNVYVNNSVTATPTLGVFSPTGGVSACVGDSALYGSTYALAIDANDTAWMSTYSTSSSATSKLLRYGAGTETVWTEPVATMEGLSFDGSGNLYAYDYGGKQPYMYSGAASASSAVAATQIGTTGASYGSAQATDGLQNTLIVNNTYTIASSGPYVVTPSTATGAVNGYTTSAASYTGGPTYYTYAIALASSSVPNNTSSFWMGNYCATNCATVGTSNSLVPVNMAGHTASFGTSTAQCAGGIFRPRGIAVDGAGNAWVSNYNIANGSVSEISAASAALSPAYTGTCTDTTTGSTAIGGFQKAFYTSNPRGIAVDPSGNVWTAIGTTLAGSAIVEFVGAAVPVVTPIAAGIAANTVGMKP